MEDKLKLLSVSLGEHRLKLNENLKYHTFSKSEGKAEGFYIATTDKELIQILNYCHDLKIPYFLIGSGTKVVLSSKVSGLVVKNRANNVKVAGVKGKVSQDGIGLESALIEADSGVSLKKLNEFAKAQKLQTIDGFSSLHSTVGGAIFLDPMLREATQKIKVWHDGEETDIGLLDLKREMVVISVVFKFKAKQ